MTVPMTTEGKRIQVSGLLHGLGSFAANIGKRAPRRKGVRLVVEGGLALLIFGFLIFTVVSQWSEIKEQGLEFSLIWILPGLLAMGIYMWLNGLVWGWILGFLGAPITLTQAQRIWALPLLLRYVPGSVLFFLARLMMAERVGVPRRVSSAGIVYELAISVSAAMSIATYFLIAHPDLSGYWFRWLPLVIIPAVILMLSPRVFGPLSSKVLRALGRQPLPRAMSFSQIIALYLSFLVIWSVMGAGVFLVAKSVHFLDLTDLPAVAASQAIGFLAAVASVFVPAGLGVRDTAFAWAVKVTLPSGSFAVGAAIAVAVRGAQTLTELLYVGGVSLFTKGNALPDEDGQAEGN